MNIWKEDARNERIKSLKSSGTERTATIAFTKTGKNTINAEIRIFEIRPDPNQIIRSGAIP
jgi:hypothetical protein